MNAQILVGHVLDVLRDLPAESVHCVYAAGVIDSDGSIGIRRFGIYILDSLACVPAEAEDSGCEEA